MGYGVLLWSIPEYNLTDGTIVPVYIKSNISQVYVIGIPSSKEKIEVPLWQITDPVSKRKVEKQAQRYSEYKSVYAYVNRDGLPMRAEPANNAKQVYRLRKDEILKVLYKGKGAAVMSGSNPLEGDWLRVLTSDGTYGWCFSYSLRLFNENDENSSMIVDQEIVEDEALETVLKTYWYPESYATMIQRKRVDLNKIKASVAFDPGASSGTVRFQIDNISVAYPYNGVTKSGNNVYKFNDTPINVTVRNPSFIVVQYSDEKGMPTSYNLVALSKSIGDVIADEVLRRNELLETILSVGPKFSSSNYGTLQFHEDNTFTWNGYQKLSPSIIPTNSGNTGKVSFNYFLDASLGFTYDGAITFTFDKNSKDVVFLYELEDGAIRLEDATGATYKESLITSRSGNPLVMYFSRVVTSSNKQKNTNTTTNTNINTNTTANENKTVSEDNTTESQIDENVAPRQNLSPDTEQLSDSNTTKAE